MKNRGNNVINTYNTSYEANISKVGNDETLFIPKALARALTWELTAKERLKVKLTPNEKGEVVIKLIPKWTPKKQTEGIKAFFKQLEEDDEPLPDNFEKTYCHEPDNYNADLFTGIEEKL
jgi:antitoxin component of MazEF toxin-antitoxin module